MNSSVGISHTHAQEPGALPNSLLIHPSCSGLGGLPGIRGRLTTNRPLPACPAVIPGPGSHARTRGCLLPLLVQISPNKNQATPSDRRTRLVYLWEETGLSGPGCLGWGQAALWAFRGCPLYVLVWYVVIWEECEKAGPTSTTESPLATLGHFFILEGEQQYTWTESLFGSSGPRWRP